MSAINIINLPIDEKAQSYAKIYSSLLSDEYQRKRAYASILSLFAFVGVLEKTQVNIQKSMTLFRNPLLNEQYEIADLYVNNWHLDVRVVNETDAVLVPKVHYDCGIVPDFYVVIKIDASLKNAELIGFADTTVDLKEAFDYHYFKIPFSSLINYDEFLEKVKTVKQEKHSQKDYELFQNSYLSLMDGGLDVPVKNEILRHLFKCSECRTEFCCFTGFEMVSCNINKYPDVLDDKTLDIIGAQSAYDSKYDGKEETIYFDDNTAQNENTEQIQQQDNISDILDEIFKEEDVQNDILENTSDLQIIEDNSDITSNIDNSAGEDMQIIQDESDLVDLTYQDKEENGLNLIEEEPENSLNDMEIIEENSVVDSSVDSELVVIKEDDEKLADTDIEFDKDTTVSDENQVQKVIVDYDETGEPIYSYITSVNQEETGSVISEIEPIEDNSDNIINNENSYDLIEDTNQIQTEDNIDEAIKDENEETDQLYQQESEEALSLEEEDKPPMEEAVETNQDTAVTQSLYDQNIQEQTQNNDFSEDEIIPSEYTETSEVQEPNNFENGEYSETEDYVESEDAQEYKEEQDYEADQEYETDEDYEEDEDYGETSGNSSNKKPVIILSLLIVVALLGSGIFLFFKGVKNKNNTASVPVENVIPPDVQTTNDMFEQPVEQENALEIPAETETPPENQTNDAQAQPKSDVLVTEDTMPAQGTIPVPPPVVQTPSANGDVNKAMANAFNQTTSGVSLKGLNWFCTAELFSDITFKNYLQTLDNKIKQNIKNNIMGVVQSPPNDVVEAKFAVDNNGNLQKIIISESSGSERIDNIVLQSIKESFQGEKSQILNDSTLKSDMYYLKVVINL